jgi:shikimate kinase
MKPSDNVILVGPMGAGKTTIGKVLANHLKLEFVDSDREIEAATGADIPWIFDVEGEAGFRERESRMIAELTARQGIVLATGGGSVLAPANRECLRAGGFVVYLRASLSQQIERTSRDKNRPLLQTPDPAGRIAELMKIRDPLYREVADIVVDTNRRSPRIVGQEIVRRLQEFRDRQQDDDSASAPGGAEENANGHS